MPYVGQLLSLGLAKESTPGTFVLPPTRFINYVPPATFAPAIQLLAEKSIYQTPDKVIKVVQGVEEFKGMKLKVEVEPMNIGEILMGAFGTDTLTGSNPYTHKFTRAAVTQLPTYTVWVNQGSGYAVFGGCMVGKLDLMIKAKELVTADVDYTGITYESGSTESQSYSSVEPFTYETAAISIAGTQINDYDECKISINNNVKADHTLSTLITPTKIYSEGYEVDISLDMYVESGNIAQWSTDFLSGTAQTFQAVLTHPQIAHGSTPYSLTLYAPVMNYKTAPFHNVASVLKIPFSAYAVYDLNNTNLSFYATLVNEQSTSY
jgi:hypothetical protein